MDAFAVGPGTVGLFASIVQLGAAPVRIPVGSLSTRWPRRTVGLAGGRLLAEVSAGAAVAPTDGPLAVIAFDLSTSGGGDIVGAYPLISELFADGVGRALGGPRRGGLARRHAGRGARGRRHPARRCPGRLALARRRGPALDGVPPPRSAGEDLAMRSGKVDRDLVAAALSPWRISLTGVALLGLGCFVRSGVFDFQVCYLAAEKRFTAGGAATALTVAFPAGVPAFWVAGRITDRHPYRPLLVEILLTYCGLLVGLTLAGDPVAVLLVSGLLAFGVHAAFPVVDTVRRSTPPAERRGSAYAVHRGLFMGVSAGEPWLVDTPTEAGKA